MDSITQQPEIETLSAAESFQVLRSKWMAITVTAVFAGIAGGVAGWLMPVTYQAVTTLLPVSSSSSSSQLGALGGLASQFGGLASLAGLSMAGDSKKAESVAALQSEVLTQQYIQQNGLLPVLFWKQWDPVKRVWRVSKPEKTPTLWKANQIFKGRIRTVTTDSKTGLVTLTIAWKDPQLAAQWANGLVKMTNDYLRDQAIRESERNIAYLNEQAAKTDSVGAKQAIYTLLQNEINKVMLARGADEYALKVIDPAFAPERPSSLGVVAWAVIGFATGFFVGIAVVLAMHRLSSRG